MCQMCEEYEAELRRIAAAERVSVADAASATRRDDNAVTRKGSQKADSTAAREALKR